MKDIFGNELSVGDDVAFNQPDYHNLIKGTIIKLTPKMVRIAYYHRDDALETLEYPYNVVKDITYS